MAAASNGNRIPGEDDELGEPLSTAGRRRRASVVTQPIAIAELPRSNEDDRVVPAPVTAPGNNYRPPRSTSNVYSPRSSSGSEQSFNMSSSRTSVSSSSSSLAGNGSSSRSRTASSISSENSNRDSVGSSRSVSSGTSNSSASKLSSISTPTVIGRPTEDGPISRSHQSHSSSTLASYEHSHTLGGIISYHSEPLSQKDTATTRKSRLFNTSTSSISSSSTGLSVLGSGSNPNSSSSSLGSFGSSTPSSTASLNLPKNFRPLNGEWRPVSNIPTMQFLHIQGRQTQREWVGFKSPSQSTGTPGLVPPNCTAFCTCSPDLIRSIADKADTENWGDGYSELSYFIDRTWHRATNLSREHPTIMGFFPDNSEFPFMILFHTCLLSKDGNGFLYGVISLAKHKLRKTEPMWIFQDVLTLDTLINAHVMESKELVGIRRHQLPRKVWYWNLHVSELYYDPSIPIEESFDGHHLFGEFGSERRNRLSPPYRGLATSELSARLRESVRMMRLYAEAGPRMVIPQYFWDKHHDDGPGQLQLLLPIAMDYTKPKEIDCCVVLRKEVVNHYETTEIAGASPAKFFYRIISLYSLAMAYSNARLIQPVDAPWLLDGYLRLLKSNGGSSASGTMGSSTSSIKSDFISEQGMRVSSGWTSSTDSESSEVSNVDSLLSEHSADSILSSSGTAASASMPSLDRISKFVASSSDVVPSDSYGAGGRQNSTSAPNLVAQQKTYSAVVAAARGRSPALTRKTSNVTTASAQSAPQNPHQLRLPGAQLTPNSLTAANIRLASIPESPFGSRRSAPPSVMGSPDTSSSATDHHHGYDPSTSAGNSLDQTELWPSLPSQHHTSHAGTPPNTISSSPLAQQQPVASPPRSPHKSKKRNSSSPASSPPTSRKEGFVNSSSSSSASSSHSSSGKNLVGSPARTSPVQLSPPSPGSPTEAPGRFSMDSNKRDTDVLVKSESDSGEHAGSSSSQSASPVLLPVPNEPIPQIPYTIGTTLHQTYSGMDHMSIQWVTDASTGHKIPLQMVSLPQGMFLVGNTGTWPQSVPMDTNNQMPTGQMVPLVYMAPAPIVSTSPPQHRHTASHHQHHHHHTEDPHYMSGSTEQDQLEADQQGELSDDSKSSHSRSKAKAKVIRVGPDIRDYSSTGYVDMVRAVRQWLVHHPNLEPEKCELAQLAVYLRKYLPELKGSGKCFAYATQAYEAGVIDLWPEKKQHYITLTPKGAAMDIGAPKGSRAFRDGGNKAKKTGKQQRGGQNASSSNEVAGDSESTSSATSPRQQNHHHHHHHKQHSRQNSHSRKSSTGTTGSLTPGNASEGSSPRSEAAPTSPATSPSGLSKSSSAGLSKRRGNSGAGQSKLSPGSAHRNRSGSGDNATPPLSPVSDPSV